MIGMKFVRWTVHSSAGNRNSRAYWNCKCDCGTERAVDGRELRRGKTKSCGCLRDELASVMHRRPEGVQLPMYVTHKAEFSAWQSLIQRCENDNNPGYHNYGGRGIQTCHRWTSGDGDKSGFECFLSDMGPRPSAEYSIDRINNDGNYEPGNCRWATRQEQHSNRRDNFIVEYCGENVTITEACKRAGVAVKTIKFRLRKGWSIERALFEPANQKYNHQSKRQEMVT